MKTYCERCGASIEDGGLRYLITINVLADFDGTLPAEGQVEDLEAFMRSLDKANPKKLEHDVFQTRAFLLCPACKEQFTKHPLHPDQDGDDEEEGRVH